MKMRLTRRSFKRKIIVFGILIFVSIALVSTGFAAWMISQGTQIEAGGNVEAGVVTDKSIGLENIMFKADSNKYVLDQDGKYVVATDYAVSLKDVQDGTKGIGFKFEPVFGDTDGRIKCNMTDGNYEALSITITGKITTVSSLESLVIKLELPAGVEEAIAKGYLVAPDESKHDVDVQPNGVTVPSSSIIVDESTDSATFTHTVSFAWGAYFVSMNPSYYYDTTQNGMNTSMEEIMTCLNELRGLVHGLTPLTDDEDNVKLVRFGDHTYKTYNADELANPDLVGPTFKLTIIANAN